MRAFLADTVALVAFFTITGILNERFVAGMDWPAIWTSRAIGLPLMILTARPYGVWRGWVVGGMPGPEVVRDTVALLPFQRPAYGAIILMGGADPAELMCGLAGVTVILLISGRPSGLWRAFIRRRFGSRADARRPMSLNR